MFANAFKRVLEFLKIKRAEIEELELINGVMPIRQEVEGSNGTLWHNFVITDGFGRKGVGGKRRGKGHYGLDLMRRRSKSGGFDYPEYARHFFCPSDVVEAVACFSGEVVRVVRDSNGVAVYVDHGRYITVYRHLKNVTVEVGDIAYKGWKLGIVSHAPKNKKGINHLHFELWDTKRRGKSVWNRERQAIDPGPFVKKWPRN